MDDDNSKSISQPEFSKACRDFKVGISDENTPILFDIFDTNRDGTLNIDEFLYAIRGELNDFRKALVEKAFRTMLTTPRSLSSFDTCFCLSTSTTLQSIQK